MSTPKAKFPTDYRSQFRAKNRDEHWEPYRIENKKNDVAYIDIMDEIGWDPWWEVGIKTADLVKEIRGIKASRIEVHINSPGGFAFDGVTIYNALRDHEAQVAVTVDGMAASAASIIAMAADELVMNRGSEVMIHDASALCYGNADDMEETRELLDRLSSDIASIYADRAGGTTAEWRNAMRGETWYSAQEAVDAGLADRIVELKETDAEEAKNRFDLRVFAHAGRAHAPAPKLRAANNGLPRVNVPANEEVAKPEDGMTPEQLEVIGLPEDATEEQISERLSELVTAELEPDPDDGGDESDEDEDTEDDDASEEEESEDSSEASIPDGTVLVDAAALAQLQASAGRADELFEKERVRTRDALLNSAVKAGKIPPARLDHWRTQYDNDAEGITKVVNELPEVIPVSEIGHGGHGEDNADANATGYDDRFLTANEKARIRAARQEA
jgi:ATP-dependent protease ClpP protease subunit